MDHGGHRENGRHKSDHYGPPLDPWMMPPQQQMKDHHTIKLMCIAAERERRSAISERDMALSEKKIALAERDLAMVQRDAAMAERDNAIEERDNAIAALHFARQREEAVAVLDAPPLKIADAPYDHSTGMHVTDASPIKARKPKKHKKDPPPTTKKPVRRDLNEEGQCKKKHRDNEWRDQDLGLNRALFDESAMPVPGCSCTGKLQPCYKWGSGGWQSACCTTRLSAYPLPMMPDKPNTRFGGRKMSGGAFAKLCTRMAADGYDLSLPLDLKDHWARHGTNRYITRK